MTRPRSRGAALAGALVWQGLSESAWAHHPGPGGESSWSWLLIVSFVLVYVAIRIGAGILEKWKAMRSDRRHSSRS